MSRTDAETTGPAVAGGAGSAADPTPPGEGADPADAAGRPEPGRPGKHGVRMTADRILAVPSAEMGERRSRAGILIPATANRDRRLVWADAVAVGPTVRNIEPGDRVLFAPDSGYEVEIRGEEYLILRERDVHAVASERAEGATGLYL